MHFVKTFAILQGVLYLFLPKVSGLFKLTNVHCESYNKSWAVFKQCRLRAINREITALYLRVDFLRPAYEINLHGAFMRKFIGGYKPFIMNFSVDACVFVKKRNNAIANVVYTLFKDFSNINHSCPYEGPQILDRFYPKHTAFSVPMPDGEYGLFLTWDLGRVKTFVTNAYFVFDRNELK